MYTITAHYSLGLLKRNILLPHASKSFRGLNKTELLAYFNSVASLLSYEITELKEI